LTWTPRARSFFGCDVAFQGFGRRKTMKLSYLGLCLAGAAAIALQTGSFGPISSAVAAETCIKSNVKMHIKPCKTMAHAKKKHASLDIPSVAST
jgi:hypothetical protein